MCKLVFLSVHNLCEYVCLCVNTVLLYVNRSLLCMNQSLVSMSWSFWRVDRSICL